MAACDGLSTFFCGGPPPLFHEPDGQPQVFGSARTCPRFVSTRHVASRKAATCRRTPRRCRGNWFMVPMHVKNRKEASMNRGTSNVEHRTSNERAKDRKRAPHPGPLPVWRGEGETATGRAAARPYPIRSSANRPYPVGRVTPPDIGCRGPCAPSGDALPDVRPTTFAAGRGLPALPGSWSRCMRNIERRLSMNLISERGSVTRSSLVCKATCCGSQSRAPFRRPGSGSRCMRKIERRLSMNHWTRRRPGRSADSLSAVSPTGSRQEIIFPASGPIADCQSAIQQTASLRYEGQIQGSMREFFGEFSLRLAGRGRIQNP